MTNGDPNYPQDQWWYPGCAANAKTLGGPLCDTPHCDQSVVKNYTEAYCSCGGIFANGCSPNRYQGCCVFTAETPVPIGDQGCFCCCGCFAYGTPVAADATTYKAIEEFQVDDMVYVADDASLGSWSQQPVRWSAGAGPGNSTMISVAFQSGSVSEYLIVNRNQPFLMSDRTLKRAVNLVPGLDSLVAADGSTHEILSLTVGNFRQGLHHIATSTAPAKSMDKHLLLAKGIVCGDWALQVALSTAGPEPTHLAPDIASLPEVGTREYQETHAHLEHTAFVAKLPGVEHKHPPVTEFKGHTGSAAYIPENAQSFVTQDQAWEIEQNSFQVPPNSGTGQEPINYLFKLFGAFNPDLLFYLDNQNQLPNAYFFEEYGRRTVVVTGGLIRTTALGLEAFALILAHQIGAALGEPPVNDDGYSCPAQADYAAVAAVLPQVFIGLRSVPVAKAGIEQLGALFGAVKQNRGGSNTCMDVALDCRLEAMQAAMQILPLPPCAGGPPAPALSVVQAQGASGTPHGQVTVMFDLPVDPTTASEVANYSFEPLVNAYSAAVAEGDPTSVVISADVKENVEYDVGVRNVLSSEQQPLTGADSASFTATGAAPVPA